MLFEVLGCPLPINTWLQELLPSCLSKAALGVLHVLYSCLLLLPEGLPCCVQSCCSPLHFLIALL